MKDATVPSAHGMKPIGGPKGGKPLRVVLFLSGPATWLRNLLKENSNQQGLYKFVGALTTTGESEVGHLLGEARVPWVINDIRRFYKERGSPITDTSLRREFDARTLELISGYCADSIALFGYRYILTDVMFAAYPWRIINIHHSDLLVMDGDGWPKYRGLRSVQDAVIGGESVTRSTVHLVTKEIDAGPILVRSQAFPVYVGLVERAREWGATDILKAYAYAQREWMIRESWGSLMGMALRLLAEERVTLKDGKDIYIDGKPGPYQVNEPILNRRSSALATVVPV